MSGAAMLGIATLGLVAAAPASATVNNDPTNSVTGATNPTSPATSYEIDCSGNSAAITNQSAPFIESLAGDTTADTALPTGATFGFSGYATLTLSNATIAALYGNNVAPASGSLPLSWSNTVGPTDSNSTGSYSFSSGTLTEPLNGGQSVNSDLTTTEGSPVVAGSAGDFPAGLASTPGTYAAVDANSAIPAGAVIVAESADGSSITLDEDATASSTGDQVSYAAAVTYTAPISTGNVFTTDGTSGQTAGVGIVSASTVSYTISIGTLKWGGTVGSGAKTCLETGWTATSPGPAEPGPAQTGGAPQTSPMLPAGYLTPLVSVNPVVPPSAAYVTLGIPTPTAGSVSVSLTQGQSKVVTLAPAGGTPPYTSCTVVPGSQTYVSGGNGASSRLTLTDNAPATCEETVADGGTGSAVITFQYTVTDTNGQTSTGGTVTVNINASQPVDQPIDEQVNGGTLNVSCNAPGTSGYPLLTCPLINLPAVQLDGQQQTSTATANTIYVSDNRGDPTVGWSLTTYLVPTTSNAASGCSTLAEFCNSNTGDIGPNAVIAGDDLAISAPTWTAASGTANAAPPTGANGNYGSTITLGSLGAGASGGTFSVNDNFTLTIPASVYAGLYEGTVEYLVS